MVLSYHVGVVMRHTLRLTKNDDHHHNHYRINLNGRNSSLSNTIINKYSITEMLSEHTKDWQEKKIQLSSCLIEFLFTTEQICPSNWINNGQWSSTIRIEQVESIWYEWKMSPTFSCTCLLSTILEWKCWMPQRNFMRHMWWSIDFPISLPIVKYGYTAVIDIFYQRSFEQK